MEFTDSKSIAAAPEDVWAALVDPDVLRACLPGCTALTGSPEEGYEATVVQKVGPVKATFVGAVTLSDMDEPRFARIEGQGKGGPAGFAKGAADVTLAPSPEGTLLSYVVTAKVGGKLAQLGSRVIDGFARQMGDAFFSEFKRQVEGPDPTPDLPDDAIGAPAEAERPGWLRRQFAGRKEPQTQGRT